MSGYEFILRGDAEVFQKIQIGCKVSVPCILSLIEASVNELGFNLQMQF